MKLALKMTMWFLHWYGYSESCPQASVEHCASLAINNLSALQPDADGLKTTVSDEYQSEAEALKELIR